MTYLNVDALQKSEKVRGSEWIKIGVDSGAGKTALPQSMTHGTTFPGDSDLTFRTATGELVRGGNRMQIEGCDDWGSNLKIRGVQAPVCKPLLSVGEYTTKGRVTVLYVDKGYMFHKGSNVAKKMDAWVQKEFREILNTEVVQLRTKKTTCTTFTRNQKKSDVIVWRFRIGGLPAGSEPVRPENLEAPKGAQNPEVPFQEEHGIQKFQEEHEIQKSQGEQMIQCRGCHEPSARQIAENDLTGHAVYRSWCRNCVALKGAHSSRKEGELPEIGIDCGFFGRDKENVLRILCVKCRNSSNWLCGSNSC